MHQVCIEVAIAIRYLILNRVRKAWCMLNKFRVFVRQAHTNTSITINQLRKNIQSLKDRDAFWEAMYMTIIILHTCFIRSPKLTFLINFSHLFGFEDNKGYYVLMTFMQNIRNFGGNLSHSSTNFISQYCTNLIIVTLISFHVVG